MTAQRRFSLYGSLQESDYVYLRKASSTDRHMQNVLKKMGIFIAPTDRNHRMYKEDEDKRKLKNIWYGTPQGELKERGEY